MLDARDKARFSWHCRRGMLELDLIFQAFLERGIEKLSSAQIKTFDALLSNTDPQLYAWLMGHEEPQDKELFEIVTLIRTNN
jgi:antitoxin CptB